MTNYTKTTDFAAKDALPSGNSAKIVKGSEIDTEFNNIATASATKANANSAALTGTTTFETISDGTIAITAFVDEDNMASDSATLLPTQQSVKAYVDSQVTAQDLDVTDGSTSIDIDLDSESLGILGGTGIDSTASGTGVTLAIDSTVATLTGSQTLSNKTLSAPVVSGNLTTDGLLDGRDVAADGTKLDGIESGATADQTAAEIKTAYESNADTNAFTDADESKLDGIEASADVTDTANVTAAGALMDSELTSEASVKALNQGVATTDSPTFAGLTTTADVSFGDNDKAIFGAGSDLQIYSDGDSSYLKENSATGSLFVDGDNIRFRTSDGSKSYALFTNSGSARLYHDNSIKIETTSTGIDVTGTATMDGLTVDGIASVSATNPKIQLFETDTTDLNTQIQNQAGDFIVSRLDDDAGSLTVHFSIDHSTGNVSIPSGDLDVTGTAAMDGLVSSGDSTIGGSSATSNVLLDLVEPTSSSDIILGVSANGSGRTQIRSTQGLGTSSDLRLLTADSGNTKERLKVASNGDISFYNSSGTSQSLFWDSSAESLGIGTTSPSSYHAPADNLVIGSSGDNGLTIASGTSSGGTICFADGTSGGAQYAGFIDYQHNGDYMRFGTNLGVERLRIDSSGNVEVKGGQELRVYRGDNATYGSMKYLTGSGGLQLNDKNGDGISFVKADGATEYGRFDASGNLLVGKTALNTNTTGLQLESDGYLSACRSGGNVFLVNRKSSDGAIITLQKDGSTVGSIDTHSGAIQFGQGNVNLAFENATDQVYPVNDNGTNNNGDIDLGKSNARFKDLYLSGGAYLGGTGSANKLDDYEEGTWTPVFSYSGGTGTGSWSYSVQEGNYTKIGRLVYFRAELRLSTFSKGSASGSPVITGLPFTSGGTSNGEHYAVNYHSYNAPTPTNAGDFPALQVGASSTQINLYVIRNNSSYGNIPDPDADSQYKIAGWYTTG